MWIREDVQESSTPTTDFIDFITNTTNHPNDSTTLYDTLDASTDSCSREQELSFEPIPAQIRALQEKLCPFEDLRTLHLISSRRHINVPTTPRVSTLRLRFERHRLVHAKSFHLRQFQLKSELWKRSCVQLKFVLSQFHHWYTTYNLTYNSTDLYATATILTRATRAN